MYSCGIYLDFQSDRIRLRIVIDEEETVYEILNSDIPGLKDMASGAEVKAELSKPKYQNRPYISAVREVLDALSGGEQTLDQLLTPILTRLGKL